MKKAWLILGLIALVLAAGGYIDQATRCHNQWDWSQFWHHESLIAIAAGIGIALLVVALIELLRKE